MIRSSFGVEIVEDTAERTGAPRVNEKLFHSFETKFSNEISSGRKNELNRLCLERFEGDPEAILENANIIGLYGVFDGHIGKFAAEYVQARLPFQLVMCTEFVEENYEAAISKAILQIHEALLICPEYYPEGWLKKNVSIVCNLKLIVPSLFV